MDKTVLQQLIDYCDYLINEWGVGDSGESALREIKDKIKNELLALEKQQIIEAWEDGYVNGSAMPETNLVQWNGEDYYNSKYKP